MRARYADGRAAILRDAACELGAEALSFNVGEARESWPYAELSRADDGNGRIILKRKPDMGERLIFEADAKDALRAAAPSLFTKRALGIERPVVVASLAGAAFTLAAVFLIGVPLAAGPIADIMPAAYRDQISDISWAQAEAMTDYCDDSDEAARILNDMTHRMMTAAHVPQRDDVWINIVDAPGVGPNAFAMPDDTIVVTAQLIDMAEKPDELAGVLAHEIAHIERNHVLKNIIGNMGAGIFFDVVIGGGGLGQALSVMSVQLASLRYSRGYEEEADARGLDYLEAAQIDPGGLARMFDHLRTQAADEETADAQAQHQGQGQNAQRQGPNIGSLLSSHPDTATRSQIARARAHAGWAQPLTDQEWAIVRGVCGRGGPATPAPVAIPPPLEVQLPGGPKPEGGEAGPKP